MGKSNKFILVLAVVFMATSGAACADDFVQPELFKRFDPTSKFKIKYQDVDTLYDTLVVDVGRSRREKARPRQPKTGTYMRVTVNRATVNEGNRLYYEAFGKDDELAAMLLSVRENLERIPSEISLEYFDRDEQLAYWLNLFNITMINEIAKVYPKRSLKKLLVGRKSIMDDKILEVAGVPLSLNDIQYTILPENYAGNPLVMYGLYYGIVGGPNIRKRAFTGDNVWRYLEFNARDFVNSNRGTTPWGKNVFRTSSLYERNDVWFDDLENDLKPHLLEYLRGPEHDRLVAARILRHDIDDWTVTDLHGTSDSVAGSIADSSAALMDTVAPEQLMAGSGGSISTGFSFASSDVIHKAPALSRYSPETLRFMQEIKLRADEANIEKATVTVEEMGEAPVEPEPEPAPSEGAENR